MAANIYKPDELKKEAYTLGLIVQAAVDAQTSLQIMMEKGIATREEITEWKSKVKNSPKYKAIYGIIEKMVNTAELYENDPQAYLKELMNIKFGQ